jgi:maltose alpha-D-glucosyltransferase/alpha-amylase
MHNALASSNDPDAFRPDPITPADVERWERGIAAEIRQVIAAMTERSAALPAEHGELLDAIAAGERRYLELIHGLGALEGEGLVKIRCHGDYHLGQLLQTGDDYIVLDFEGEPARSLAERRAKTCPLRDVAGLLRSFDYAAYGALFQLWQERQPDDRQKAMLEAWVRIWEEVVRTAFLAVYQEAVADNTGPRFVPSDPEAFAGIVRIFEIEKAFYELLYELNNRPAWLPIPARGLLRTLSVA